MSLENRYKKFRSIGIGPADILRKKTQATTERIKSAFTSVNDTVATLTSSIGGLFGTLSGTEDFRISQAIEDQIKKDNEAREEALRLQNRLIRSQITAQNIKNKQAREGGGQVNISMDGVYPELEMIMWEIIKRVQIQVAESEADFLAVSQSPA